MGSNKFFLSADAKADLVKIRRYTIKKWSDAQWQLYKNSLFNSFQNLAANPSIGIKIEEEELQIRAKINAFRFPLKDHIIYYLHRKKGIVVVGVLSTSIAPEKHQHRVKIST